MAFPGEPPPSLPIGPPDQASRRTHSRTPSLRVTVRAGRVVIAVDLPATGSADGKARAGAAAENVNDQRERVEADKNGMSVSTVTFADVIGIGATEERRVLLTNLGVQARTMSAKLIISKLRRDGLTREPFALGGIADAVTIDAGKQVAFTVTARPTSAGVSRDILSINFDNAFTIGRYLEVRCGDAEMLDLLKAQAPYVKPKRKAPAPPRHLIEVLGAPAYGGGGNPNKGPTLKLYELLNSSWRGILAEPAEADYQVAGTVQTSWRRARIASRSMGPRHTPWDPTTPPGSHEH
jgi:hypothetical protein